MGFPLQSEQPNHSRSIALLGYNHTTLVIVRFPLYFLLFPFRVDSYQASLPRSLEFS